MNYCDGVRSMLVGGHFPMTPQEIAQNPDTQIAPLGLDTSSFAHMMRNYQVTLSVQQLLPGKFVAQAALVSSVSRHLEQLGAANPTIDVDPITGHPHRVYDGLAAIPVLTNGGRSSYNSLQLGLTRRFVDELTMNVAYGWAHSIGDTEGSGDAPLVQNPSCMACERADNNFDVRQSIQASVLYTLPFGADRRHLNQGLISHLVGGWSLGGIWNARTGLPLNVTINRPDEIWRDNQTGAYIGGDGDIATATPLVNTPGGGGGVRGAFARHLRQPRPKFPARARVLADRLSDLTQLQDLGRARDHLPRRSLQPSQSHELRQSKRGAAGHPD